MSEKKVESIVLDAESGVEVISKPSFLARVSSLWKRETMTPTVSAREKATLNNLEDWARLPPEHAVKKLNSSVEGLESSDAARVLAKHGLNELSNVKPPSWWWLLLSAIPNTFNILLVILGIISIATGDDATFGILLIMVALSVGLRFFQELKSNRAAQSLVGLITADCDVLRRESCLPATIRSIHRKELVPGDVISLSTGCVAPADCMVLDSNMLTVSQSSLTGEGLSVEKLPSHVLLPKDVTLNAFDCQNIIFGGSYVVSGSGRALVLTTGDDTYVATMASVFTKSKPTNAFQRGIRRVSLLLLVFMLVMAPLVLVIEGFVTKDWKAAGLFCISVAVGLVPEMMPMIVNGNLARGAIQMAKKKVIVKRLDAIQNTGAMNIICSDKTGTLTEDDIQLFAATDPYGNENLQTLAWANLNASLQKGLKNQLDNAVIRAAEDKKVPPMELTKTGEIPFDFVRRLLSVVVENDKGRKTLVCKGAAEELMRKCTQMRIGQDIIPIDRDRLASVVSNMNRDGLRVVGVATRSSYLAKADVPSPADERDMTCEGFLAFLDPPKEDARSAVKQLLDLGVETKVLTGDNLETAVKVCKQLGILESHDQAISGADLDLLSPASFATTVANRKLFAKLTPIQKMQVVQALQKNGNTVGFLGDGINDAPALRVADCGISVDSATDIAKDAADIILTEKSLMVIVDAVKVGRITHMNTIKYIKMAASSNFGNVFSVLAASAWLPFTPMLPVQLLTQNLAYDISQGSIPWDHVDEEMIQRPRPWDTKSIARFMLCLGPTSSVFDITTFALGW